jgi:hypothetical protein
LTTEVSIFFLPESHPRPERAKDKVVFELVKDI